MLYINTSSLNYKLRLMRYTLHLFLNELIDKIELSISNYLAVTDGDNVSLKYILSDYSMLLQGSFSIESLPELVSRQSNTPIYIYLQSANRFRVAQIVSQTTWLFATAIGLHWTHALQRYY
jgi:hypothetical protein